MAKKKIIIIGRGGGQNQDVPADIAELQQQIQRLTAERNALSLQLGVVQGELEQANANVNTLTSEKVALQQAVDELNNQIETLNKRILELEETIKNLGGDVPGGEIIPGGPHNPENDAFEEDFLWIENIDDTDGTITLNLEEAPFMYYSYDNDTEFQKMVNTNVLSIPAHSKIYLRWKGKITCSSSGGFISNKSSNCNHNIGGELKNGGLKSYVYQYLFSSDKKLIDASELKLSATTLTEGCYYGMFQGCTSLTQAPEPPATTLANFCYQNMFKDCTSLTQAPELPATTLASQCYSNMFQGCTSLTQAPELPATALTSTYYISMFQGCTSLNYVKTNVINWNTSYASSWLKDVAPTGVIEVSPLSNIPENSTSGVPSGWTKQITTDVKNTINIHNISGLENTISIPNKFSSFKYKTNNDTEYNENPKTTTLTVTLQPDETLTIEGIYYPGTSNTSFDGIKSTENINVSGEVNYSMPYMLLCLFSYNTKLVDASQLKLSATTLAIYCYQSMFSNCTSLTTAPELPATTLDKYCYQSMFHNCTSLTTAPELPAITLAQKCYNNMFGSCDKLNSITFLSTEPFIYNDYNAKYLWVQGVSKTGTFRTPIENKEWIENYPRGTSAVPSGWTIEYI